MHTKFTETHLMLCLTDREVAQAIHALTYLEATPSIPKKYRKTLRSMRDKLEEGRIKLPDGRFVLLDADEK